jgi:hypothetical protein
MWRGQTARNRRRGAASWKCPHLSEDAWAEASTVRDIVDEAEDETAEYGSKSRAVGVMVGGKR